MRSWLGWIFPYIRRLELDVEELKQERWLLWQTIARMRGMALSTAQPGSTPAETAVQDDKPRHKPVSRPSIRRTIQKREAEDRAAVAEVEKNLRLAREERQRQAKVKSHTDPTMKSRHA